MALINQILDEALAEQEGDLDPDTRWALTWFEQSGFDEGEYGVAEQLSKSTEMLCGGSRRLRPICTRMALDIGTRRSPQSPSSRMIAPSSSSATPTQ